MALGSSTLFDSQFLDQNTGDPLTLHSTSFTLFDLDKGGIPGSLESFTFCDPKFVFVLNDPTLITQSTSDGCNVFTATLEAGGSNNPSDPKSLTEEQKQLSVGLQGDNFSGFQITYTNTGG